MAGRCGRWASPSTWRVTKDSADTAARTAATAVSAATTRAAALAGRADRSAAAAANYQQQLNSFANASFRGARLSPLSVMLTARSANDFLDEATVIARVAADSRRTMTIALQARTTAVQASQQARDAQRDAERALTQANVARDAAAAAAAAAQQQKTALDVAVKKYNMLYQRLSATERAAAAAAAAKARAESEAAAHAAQAQLAAQAQASAAAAAQQLTTPSPAPAAASPSSPGSAATTALSPLPRITSSNPSSSTVTAASSSSVSGSGDAAGEIAAQAALTKVGGGYCYACDGPSSFDCSGLTTWAWAQAGIAIPRVSYAQANFPVVPLD